MGFFKTYKQRKIEATATQPDVYSYEPIPNNVRAQIWHIIVEIFGYYNTDSFSRQIYAAVQKFFLKELGVFSLKDYFGLHREYGENSQIDIGDFFLNVQDHDLFLSITEYFFRIASEGQNIGGFRYDWFETHPYPEKAIEELSIRFQRANLGYEFVDGLIIRIDSKEIHKKVVKPSLALLSSEKVYKGAGDEYKAAFTFSMEGKYEQVLAECNKALESSLLAIITKQKRPKPTNSTIGVLVTTCKHNNLYPLYTAEYLGQQSTSSTERSFFNKE